MELIVCTFFTVKALQKSEQFLALLFFTVSVFRRLLVSRHQCSFKCWFISWSWACASSYVLDTWRSVQFWFWYWSEVWRSISGKQYKYNRGGNQLQIRWLQIELHFFRQVALVSRQRRDLLVIESSCHLSITHGGGFTLSLYNCWRSSKEAVNTKFYSLWFEPAGNGTGVYRFSIVTNIIFSDYGFSSRRSIHSTTDR